MNKTYFGYTRVSTVKQGDGVSLNAQKEAIERYAAQHGLVVSKWLEEKETAAKLGRPIFTKMIKDLHAKHADGVIIHKIDRSARNLRDWASVGELQDVGIDVHFAAESVDFASRGGRLTADIQAVIAADFIRNHKDEVRKGQLGCLKIGLYPFTAPMGYLDRGKGHPKTIDPVTGPYVRLIFELYATGQYSLKSLQRELWKRGARTKNGKKIYRGKIETILANPFYTGVILIITTGETHQGIHEPLISLDLYRTTQKIKENRSRRKKTKHDHIYRGLFKCTECKNSMTPERQRGHVYYRCHTKPCPSNSIRGKVLEENILEELSKLQIIPSQVVSFQGALKSWLDQLPKTTNRDTHRVQEARLGAAKDKLTDAMMFGSVDDDTYKRKLKELHFRQAELSNTQKNLQSEQQKGTFAGEFLEHAKNLCQTYFFANHSEKRQMIDLCFSNMSVFAKKVELQTQNWLVEALDFQLAPSCAPDSGENRSRSELGLTPIEQQITRINCPECKRLVELCNEIGKRQSRDQLPKTTSHAAYDQVD